MALTGQPTFEARDVPTATQLNAWMTTISNKFGSGSTANTCIKAADMAWPFVAGGHLNMAGYALSGVPVLAARYNLERRRPWQSVGMLFREIEARGGGVALLPGNTTQTAQTDNKGFTGVPVGSNTAYVGHGISSVSGQIYCDRKTNVIVRDMLVGGNSQFSECENVLFYNVDFTATTGGSQLRLNNCKNVWIVDCRFEGAVSNSIDISNGYTNLHIIGSYFNNWTDTALLISVRDGARDLFVADNVFAHTAAYAGTGGYAVMLAGTPTTTSVRTVASVSVNTYLLDLSQHILRNNVFLNVGGISSLGLNELRLRNNVFADEGTANPLISYVRPATSRYDDSRRWGGLRVSGCVATGAVGVALRTTKSQHMQIRGSVFYGAGDVATIDPVRYYTGVAQQITRSQLIGTTFWATASNDAVQLWNLTTDDTQQTIGMIVFGCHMDSTTSNKGFVTYLTNPGTEGATIGGTATTRRSYFIFAANNSENTETAGGANDDMVHNTANKVVCLSTSDDTTPINNTLN